MSAVVNLSFKLGETWSLDATCRDSLGSVINLTGATIKWRLSLNGAPALDCSLGNGITIVSAAGGECLITVTPAMQVAAGLSAAFYQHQCRVTLADASVSDQFAGSFAVTPSLF